MEIINGLSKMDKETKIKWLMGQLSKDIANDDISITETDIQKFWHQNSDEQKVFDEFSENTISNFYFPYGIAPNFSINNKIYTVPLVTEESSVVAAACKSAKFWLKRGGFQAKVISTTKKGQVHFIWKGEREKLYNFFSVIKSRLLFSIKDLVCLLYTSPSPRDGLLSRMPSSA